MTNDTTGLPTGLKVAVVHEWFVDYSGSERVVEQMLACFPQADLFSVVDFLDDDARGFLGGRRATTTFIQRLPGARKRFRSYLALMPIAIEQLDLSAYDIVLTSSHAVAKGVLTGPDQLHVSYVHSPMRYAWDLQHVYLRESGLTRGPKSWLTRYMLHRLRLWDVRSALGPDLILANSAYIARRIAKTWRREAKIVHPPVAVTAIAERAEKGAAYLAASRIVPYKRMDLIVEAFRDMPDQRLTVIGDGPGIDRLRARATPNVTIMGFQPTEVLRRAMGEARALIFAAEEDFGIVPVEAQAAGTPVIAYGRGGAVETVRDLDDERPTGVLFHEQSPAAIRDAVERFEANRSRITSEACRAHAEAFSEETFRDRYRAEVTLAWLALRQGVKPLRS